MSHRRGHLLSTRIYYRKQHAIVNVYRLEIMGRKVDLDDLIDVGEVAELLGLAHKNSVTTYMRRYEDFPKPAVEFADGKCRAWIREDVQAWKRSFDGD